MDKDSKNEAVAVVLLGPGGHIGRSRRADASRICGPIHGRADSHANAVQELFRPLISASLFKEVPLIQCKDKRSTLSCRYAPRYDSRCSNDICRSSDGALYRAYIVRPP